MLADDHCPIVEVADTLPGAFAFFHDANVEVFARKVLRLESVGDVVEIHDFDVEDTGDLIEVDVVGHDACAELAGDFDEILVARRRQLVVMRRGIVDLDVGRGALLEFAEDIQSATSSSSSNFVVRFGDFLKFLDDEAGNDDAGIDEFGFDEVEDAPVDQGRSIENERSPPFEFAGELNVRDDEAEVILGLQKEGNTPVREQKRRQKTDQILVRAAGPAEDFLFEDRSNGKLEHITEHESDEQAEVNSREVLDPFSLDRHVGKDCSEHDSHH